MPRYKYYDYNQTVMIAIELEKQIIAGTLEYAIHKLVEERVKIEPFEKKIRNDETGRPAVGGINYWHWLFSVAL